ncbi:thioredoxin domain-containing protein [Kineosporia sp. R_H_3]|uniref:thioredoxin domain-containing protein n=1 Tax=Kineosporia sp. R_H_3 TaxID=1961848 RepID=UPI000B4AC471|nr:thioredoxin domain-containing protein [Kineosporia sp. R_H_3]
MVNRLAHATSPYLLQHKDNPVDWREWGDDAFDEARRRDVPVLLSIGYAACHWCHVMAHESFEDDVTAAQMNEGFVNVKVDREERPDVDAVYMSATQALTGQGGWPMTVFLTHEGKPFYAGTYFPPVPAHGRPSFRQLLSAISDTWATRREEVEGAGSRIAEAVGRRTLPSGGAAPDAATLAAAVRALARDEDAEHHGFGGAPKFPPSMNLEALLRHAARRRLEDAEAAAAPSAAAPAVDLTAVDDTGPVALGLAARTLTTMARSGMYDQVAGGFARYAVDRAWVVPHFEKMLYDNALLARVYLHWWRLTGEPTGARVALETCDWMLADLLTPAGGLASSLDADTPVRDEHGHVRGVEGYTYAWTPQLLVEALGADDGAWAAQLCRVTPAGTFEHGTSTLQLDRDVQADPAQAPRWRDVRERLRTARAARPQPGRDDKVVAAWNGLAVAALAETGALLDRPDLVAAAERAADLLLAVHLVEEPGPGGRPRVRLRRVSRDGVAGAPAGVLEDYGDVAEGLLALHAVTGETSWLTVAGRLLDTVLDEFGDGSGGFYDTPADGTDAAVAAVGRPSDPTDNAYPGGWSAAAHALLTYAALTGSGRHRAAAEAALGVVGAVGPQAPRAVGWGLAAAEALLDGPREVAVAGPDGDPLRARLHAVALAATAPGAVVSAGPPDAEDAPLLAGRPLVAGSAAAYVCRQFVCAAPTTSAEALAASLGAVRVAPVSGDRGLPSA